MNKRPSPFHSLADAKRPASSRAEHTPSTSPIDFAAGRGETRVLARRRLVVQQSDATTPSPPPVRAQRTPSRRLYSICFTWPAGRPWLGEKTDRNPPCWYAERVTAFIAARAADGTSSIQVALHGAIQAEAVAALERRWRAAFDEARGSGSASARGGQQETLTIVRTAADAHPMLPIALRGVPLLDDASERVVLCLDVHDSLARQAVEIDALIAQMEDEGRCAAFSAWAGYDLRSSFRRDDATIAPPRRLTPERTQREADHGVVWHLDCGLLVTLPAFRRRLRALRGIGSYASHVAHCHAAYAFESAKGTDEMMLEMFLISAQPCGRDVGNGGGSGLGKGGRGGGSGSHGSGGSGGGGGSAALLRLVRECASLRVHTLCAEAKKGRRAKSLWSDMPHDELPPYERQGARALQFVYDDGARPLRPPRPFPATSNALPRHCTDWIRFHDPLVTEVRHAAHSRAHAAARGSGDARLAWGEEQL